MGLAKARIRLENPKRTNLRPVEADALADPGAPFCASRERCGFNCSLRPPKKEVTTAAGKRSLCPYDGPIRVQFEKRECNVGAVVLGDEVLLGAVPMEDMDLVVVPAMKKVVANPLHPIFPGGPVKQSRHVRR